MLPTARAMAGQKKTGARPIATHARAERQHRPAHRRAASRARARPPPMRGAPRKTTPQTLTKHASASAPVTPSNTAAGIAAHADAPREIVASNKPR